MTVFEQHVDLSQVATEPTLLGVVLTFLISIIVFGSIMYLFDYAIGFVLAFVAFFAVGWVTAVLTANNTVTAQPARVENALNKSSYDKPLFADKYRNEINAGIAEKLDSYTIDNVDLTDDSILTGGYYDHDITAHRDGKNYLLHPETSFDKSTSTVRITVDVEQLPFNRTTKE